MLLHIIRVLQMYGSGPVTNVIPERRGAVLQW